MSTVSARGVEVLGLRCQRVGFAIEFLHEEIEAAAGGLAAGHDAAGFLDVAGEPVELFGHVQTLQLQHQFLLDAIAIHGGQQFGDAFVQAGAHARLDFRQPRAHLRSPAWPAPRNAAR